MIFNSMSDLGGSSLGNSMKNIDWKSLIKTFAPIVIGMKNPLVGASMMNTMNSIDQQKEERDRQRQEFEWKKENIERERAFKEWQMQKEMEQEEQKKKLAQGLMGNLPAAPEGQEANFGVTGQVLGNPELFDVGDLVKIASQYGQQPDPYEQEKRQAELDYLKAKTEHENRMGHDNSSSSSSSSSGSLGKTQFYNTLASRMSQYRSSTDALKDLERNQAAIVSQIGLNNYTKLYNSVMDETIKTGTNFMSGQGSPIADLFGGQKRTYGTNTPVQPQKQVKPKIDNSSKIVQKQFKSNKTGKIETLFQGVKNKKWYTSAKEAMAN